uniref:Uncharacterized protein n=1 Tax=Rhizophora mucronata TaxID=61149 RepID=A0A2P2P769_RHIMU
MDRYIKECKFQYLKRY